MSILLVGLNHRTAPVDLRERLALADSSLTLALEELPVDGGGFDVDPRLDLTPAPPALREGAILSTCNRLEIYALAREIPGGRRAIEDFLGRLQGTPLSALKPHLYFMHDQDAVVHLMRVAAGLDSMILGEPQILGQVAQAFASAQAANTTGPVLSHLLTQAVHVGKRARSETDISRHTTSVGHAAAQLAEERLGGLANAKVLVVGAGEMAEMAVQALQMRGAAQITCMNRTYSGGEALAEKVGGRALAWHHLTEGLTWADVVVSATGAPHTVIQVDEVLAALPGREARPLVVIDIAVPRDVEEAVGDLPGVHRYDIDDLRSALDENLAQRKAAVPGVEAIIAEEAAAFAEWMGGRQVVPVIADLRTWAREIARAEIERALNRLEQPGSREREIVDVLAHRLVGRLLHEPTMQLRKHAASGNGYVYAQLVRELFGLSDSQYRPNSSGRDGNGHEQSACVPRPTVAVD